MSFPPIRNLVAITRTYYRLHGLKATISRAATKTVHLLQGVPSPEAAVPSLEAACVPFRFDTLQPTGPIQGGMTLVQEIRSDFDHIDRIELLLATYARRNTNLNDVTLLDSAGEVIYRGSFPSRAVIDNHFRTVVRLNGAQRQAGSRLFLVVRSMTGSRRNGIAVWRAPDAAGSAWVGRHLPDSEILDCIGGSNGRHRADRLPGSLVYRVVGRRTSTEPRYRQPPWPSDFQVRAASPRVVVVASAGDAPAGGGETTVRCTPQVAVGRLQQGLADVVVIEQMAFDDQVRALLKQAHSMHAPTVYVASAANALARRHAALPRAKHPVAGFNAEDDRAFASLQALRACTFAACPAPDVAAMVKRQGKRMLGPVPTPSAIATDEASATTLAKAAMAAYRRLQRPVVSIVTILYNKAVELPIVLQSYERQTYEGEIEIVFVDDMSPDDSVAVVERWGRDRADRPDHRPLGVQVVRNDGNLGNCRSRNVGIAAAKGDLLIIIDADCLLNRDFVLRHVEAHAFDDCEVVIGPLNIETKGRDPFEVLDEHERDPGLALAHAELQDRVYRPSFLNCITRNFSIKREAITDELFDPLFSYSADPDSGFGWEDVEMGYRLYRHGARVKFVEEAISIHVSPAHVGPEGTKPARSLKNFRRLFEKHPEFGLVARRWANETFSKICAWADATGVDVAADKAWVARAIGASRPVPLVRPQRPRRVLTYRWHVPHQYELYKLPFDFTLLTGLGNGMTEEWEYGQRPMPSNARFARFDEIDPNDFDFAILHFDENVLAPENTNGVIGPEWGSPFKWFCQNLAIPKVAVCHGTPQFRGQYTFDYRGGDLMQVIESERQRLVDYLGEITVVCNSHQAEREWRFRKSRVIWHGFDPAEFPPATYERGIVSPLGPLVMSRPHYRGYFLYREVFDGYFDELKPEKLRVPEPHVAYSGNAYAHAKYRNYVDELRRYTVYFNPTLRSPMPRARTEPMMCGVIPVSARNHDVEMFIQNGVNGFYGDTADELREQLRFLARNPDEARKIGANARRTAMEVFNYDRFLGDWLGLVRDLLG